MADSNSGYNYLYTRKVTLSDDSEWIGSAETTSDGDYLWVWLDPSYSLLEVLSSFSDPEKTSTIVSETASMIDPTVLTKTFSGYTKLSDISVRDKETNVCLKKEGV